MTLSRKLAVLIAQKDIQLDILISLLEKYNLLSLLPEIKKSLMHVKRLEEDEKLVHIESPFPLTTASLAHIKKMIRADAPEKVTINTDLLAGFRATYKGTLYDGSAARIIKQLINHK